MEFSELLISLPLPPIIEEPYELQDNVLYLPPIIDEYLE